MIVNNEFEQNSVDWEILRSGKVTASEADALVSPLGKIRESKGVETYLAQKLCELWTGGPLLSLSGIFDIDQGKILEERAKPAFTLHTGIESHNVAFIETDDHRAGCSPDLMIGKDSGAEVKCPRIDTHIGYLLAGELPSIYVAQVQFSMFVTGFETWHFFSYNRQLPPLHIIVERDEKFQSAIRAALSEFIERLDAGMATLIKLNGGPPARRLQYVMQPIVERGDENSDFHADGTVRDLIP